MKMKEFRLGVNYWASHTGTDMWIRWDAETVRKDFETLRENGLQVLRVFPNWRDFQPVTALYSAGHRLREYRMTGDVPPDNPFFLSREMTEHFHEFCALAEEAGLELIVGLVTGWMSGRLFVPPALQDRHLFTDPAALWLQQLYVSGMVKELKDEKCILAWDLGNECNCMEETVTREAAAAWTAMITNAIRAKDPGRPVISGMHSLTADGVWTLQDQGFFTDILTTHPYPYWVEHADAAPQDDYSTLMHATAQTRLYADIGGKPCLVEEIGTMGPMVCSDETAAGFLRVNLWSAWAYGAPGLLWWCAFDQDHLNQPPYDWNMVERELGLLDRNRRPKITAKEFPDFRKAMDSLSIDLPPARTDAVCLLTRDQDQAGIGYMTWLLARRAGLTLRFACCGQELPDSRFYFLPSVSGGVMSKRTYDRLKQKTAEGASLYISLNDGILTEFEELTGWKTVRSCRRKEQGSYRLEGTEIPFRKDYCFELENTGGEALARDEKGNPVFGRHAFGKGTVWLLNYPAEKNLLQECAADWLEKTCAVYRRMAAETLRTGPVFVSNPEIGLTIHPEENGEIYAVLINYSPQQQESGLQFAPGCGKAEVIYGDAETLPPFGAAVLRIGK